MDKGWNGIRSNGTWIKGIRLMAKVTCIKATYLCLSLYPLAICLSLYTCPLILVPLSVLYLQPSFSCSFRDAFHPAVEFIRPAVEHRGVDFFLDRFLRKRFANRERLLALCRFVLCPRKARLARAALSLVPSSSFPAARNCGNGPVRRIINQLRIHRFIRAAHRKPRPFGSTKNRGAYARNPAKPLPIGRFDVFHGVGINE